MSSRTVGNHDISPEAMQAYRAAKALHRDGGSPASVFALLATIVEDRTWERLHSNSGEPFGSFTAFVEAAEPGGLGTSRAELVKLLALRHPHEDGPEWRERGPWLRTEVARLLAEDVPAAGDIGRPTRNVRATHNSAGTGPDSVSRVTARLKRDDPALAARVVAGDITPNAAARQKGWRKPRIVLTSPASVAVRVRQHFTPGQVAELRALLDDP